MIIVFCQSSKTTESLETAMKKERRDNRNNKYLISRPLPRNWLEL